MEFLVYIQIFNIASVLPDGFCIYFKMLPFYRKLIDYLMNYNYHNSSYLEGQTLGIIGNFAIALCISIVIY